MPDYTVKNMPPLPERWGPEIEWGLTPNKPHVWLTSKHGWQVGTKASDVPFIYALKSKPWYPPSWFGPDGKPLGRIVEHSGGWPTECGPSDEVMVLSNMDRKNHYDRTSEWRRIDFLAYVANWESIAAYMIKQKDA